MALMMALSAVSTGAVTMGVAFWAMQRQARSAAVDNARLVAQTVEPLAIEVVLKPGDPDLVLALDGRLEALRRDPAVVRIAVVDHEGQRIPVTDEAPAPEIRGGAVHVVHRGSVVVAHPIAFGDTTLGYLAVETRFPWWSIVRDTALLAVATGLVMAMAVLGALLASAPATADLRRITAAIERLGRGDLWTASGLREGRDEIGRVAIALRELGGRLELAAAERARTPLVPEENADDGDLPVEWSDVPIGPLLERIAAAAPDPRPGVRLETDLQVGSVVRTDADAVGTVIRHLLDNACRLTETGQITLSAHEEADGDVLITVQDTGPGLSDLAYRYLFRPVPGDNGNYGVGLAVAGRYARSIGARLEHDPRYHRGARFVLRLPGRALGEDRPG